MLPPRQKGYVMVYIGLAVFGFLTGMSATLFGFGGGFIVVPVLYWVIRSIASDGAVREAAMHIAVATSSCVMIVNAVAATRKHQQAGNIVWTRVFPLAWYIAVGAILGVVLISLANSDLVRTGFALYIAVTIADCFLRKGFLQNESGRTSASMTASFTAAAGFAIGTIASFIGVGGSVMTVPLMRRQGMTMKQAVAVANPLSLPVAVAATATYLGMALYRPVELGSGYVGYIHVPAFAFLSAFSILGVRASVPLFGRISDRVHARVYLFLLIVVLLSMLF